MSDINYQVYVDNLMADGSKISNQNAGDRGFGRLSSVDALADLNSQQIAEVLKRYNQENNSANLPDATFDQDQYGLYITFNDSEVPTTVTAQSARRNEGMSIPLPPSESEPTRRKEIGQKNHP